MHSKPSGSDKTQLALSYRHNWDSRETLGGIVLDSSRNNGTPVFCATTILGKQCQLMGQYLRDVMARAGPMTEHCIRFRLAYIC